jgi:transcriptional regulator with XRE-family HTH domain
MANKKLTLGQLLKDQRELKKMSLRQVETLTKISNAYLSQLENDKIKGPSVNILYKLAEFYEVDFNALLETAGIVKRKSSDDTKKKALTSFALSSEKLNEEEEEELMKYLKFLRSQKNGK